MINWNNYGVYRECSRVGNEIRKVNDDVNRISCLGNEIFILIN